MDENFQREAFDFPNLRAEPTPRARPTGFAEPSDQEASAEAGEEAAPAPKKMPAGAMGMPGTITALNLLI